MRIHTDVLMWSDFHKAVHNLPGVYVNAAYHGSRDKSHAFEVTLEGNGYRKNSGKNGADPEMYGATWDEWGVFLAYLFDLDPDMRCGSKKYPTYENAEHFHFVTNERFKDSPGVLPEDTHKWHNWKPVEQRPSVSKFSKCSAIRRWDW